jgi:hypothetical protein
MGQAVDKLFITMLFIDTYQQKNELSTFRNSLFEMMSTMPGAPNPCKKAMELTCQHYQHL